MENSQTLKGIEAIEKGDFIEAIKILTTASTNDSYIEKNRTNYYLGYCYFNIRDFEKSKKFAGLFFDSNVSDKLNVKILVLSCLYLNQIEEAKKIINIHLNNSYYPDDDILSLYEKIYQQKFTCNQRFPRLNILFIQESAGIRCYKYAKALSLKGHKVTLLYLIKKPSDNYVGLDDSVFYEIIKLKQVFDIPLIAKNFDIIHCHNESDYLTIPALISGRPVIHDTADLISLRDIENPYSSYFEGLANMGATARIYSTKYQQKEAEKIYKLISPSLIFGNYISESDKPRCFLPKLSKEDGNIHVVYPGTITLQKHRNMFEIFINIAQKDVHLHIYPSLFINEIAEFLKQFPNIHYHQPEAPYNLITNMTQYDIGLIPWNLELGNKEFLDSTIANKFYDYLAAKLPMLTSNILSYSEFFKENNVGLTFEKISEIYPKLIELKQSFQNLDFSKYSQTFENQIHFLEEFYFHVIEYFNKHMYDLNNKILIEKLRLSQLELSNKNFYIQNNFSNKFNENILFVIHSVENIGGAAITIKELAIEFKNRGSKVYLLTNNIAEEDLVGIESVFDKIILFKDCNLNKFPDDEDIVKFSRIYKSNVSKYNIKLVITFPFYPSYYVESCNKDINIRSIHYVTYEPAFTGEFIKEKIEFLSQFHDRILFLNKAGIEFLYLNISLNKGFIFNYIGVPIIDYKQLISLKKEQFFNDSTLSVVIISRFAPTKSFVLNALEDIIKLISKGYKIKLTIYGEGDYELLLKHIINLKNVQDNILINRSQFPLKYNELIKYDLSIGMGTTAIMTAAMGIPTLYAIPTTWFEYFQYFTGYAGSLGLLGVDYFYFMDPFSPENQKYTYFDFIKSIFELEDIQGYLKTLSERSKEYCEKYEKYFDRSKIVNSMLYYIENKNS